MNKVNSLASKMSKSQVLQLIDQKIDDFLNLSDSIKNIPLILAFTSKAKEKKFYDLFIETIKIILTISIDEGIHFVLHATSISPEDLSFKNLKLLIFKINNYSEIEKSLYNDVCRELLKEIAIKFLFLVVETCSFKMLNMNLIF